MPRHAGCIATDYPPIPTRHSASQPQFRPRWRGRGNARTWHGVSSRELYHFCRAPCWLSLQISVAAKVSVVRREQILVLNQNRRGLSTFQLFNRRSPPGSAQPFNFSTSQVPRKLPRSSVTFIQAYTVKHILKGPFCLFGRLSRPYAESLF